jgi:outer membrane protein OmpA-like peptidoglycan-associated protein
MKFAGYLKIVACAATLAGCAASFPPTELIEARQACAHASATPATLLVPSEMRKAHEALATAEESFLDSHDSYRTRDLASQAYRQAKRAEALAKIAADNAITETADKMYDAARTELVENTKRSLDAADSAGKLALEQPPSQSQVGLNAGIHLIANLSKLGTVTEENRGLVCTLSGDTIFDMNTANLTPASHYILEQITHALMATKERRLTVEGHTDSRGSLRLNRELSQDRADSIRAYIISCGYPGNLIVARGVGTAKPVADNSSVEGRAKNRRVEIIVARATR